MKSATVLWQTKLQLGTVATLYGQQYRISFEVVLYWTVSWSIQSKRQPVADLALRCIKEPTILEFYPTWLLHTLTLLLPLQNHNQSQFPVGKITAKLGRVGRKSCQFMLCNCLQLPVSGITSQSLGIHQHCCQWIQTFPGSSPFQPVFLCLNSL